MPPSSESLVVFVLDSRHFALRLPVVERVERAVEIAPLPGSPRGVRGVINLRGKIVPVFDLRVHFGMPERELRLGDQLIIAQVRGRSVALVADEVEGVVERGAASLVPAEEIARGVASFEGALKHGGEVVLLHDLERFLSLEGTAALEAALSAES